MPVQATATTPRVVEVAPRPLTAPAAPEPADSAPLRAFQSRLQESVLALRNALPLGGHGEAVGRPEMTAIDTPEGMPEAWDQPASTRIEGKCGITGVCNMLRHYGIEISPEDINNSTYRGWIGMDAAKFAWDLTQLSGQNFEARSIPDGQDPLATLRGHLDEGRPVGVLYMTGRLSAHWVVATDIEDSEDGPVVIVQSWGGYHRIPWSDLQDNWENAWDGPYPHVVQEG